MPMLAVVALAAGATAGAVAAGVALATAVTYVGIGMTVVGAITKNKNMMKVGSIMGIAGGVMSIAGIGTTAGAASAAGEGLTSEAIASASAEGATEAGTAAWADAAAESAGSLTAESFSTGGAGAIPGSAAAVPGEIAGAASGAASGSNGLLNSSISPTGAYQAPAIPGSSTAVVDNIMTSSTPAATAPNASVSNLSGIAGQVKPGVVSQDKKGLWNSLDTTTKNEIIKGGLTGAAKFFEGWSQSEKADWERDRLAEQQKNLNAQPRIQRYSPKTGLLGSSTKKMVA